MKDVNNSFYYFMVLLIGEHPHLLSYKQYYSPSNQQPDPITTIVINPKQQKCFLSLSRV
jgi:hypothetical protein